MYIILNLMLDFFLSKNAISKRVIGSRDCEEKLLRFSNGKGTHNAIPDK